MLLLEAIRILSTTKEPDAAGGGAGKRRRQSATTKTESLLIPGLPDDIALNCLALARRSDHPSLACLNARFSALIDSGYLYSLRRRMGVAEHWIYLVCDLGAWDAFDPTTHRWVRLPKIPCDDCFAHADKESLAVGHRLLVFGREIADFAVWGYDGPRRGWTRCRPMRSPRCLFGSGSAGKAAIVAGGIDKRGIALRSAEMYDADTGEWETLPDMGQPRKMCSGFFMKGKFFVIGGLSGDNAPLNCGEEYDLDTRRWRRIEGMWAAGAGAGAAPPLVAVMEGRLYGVEHESNMVKRWEGEGNGWAVVGRLPVRADVSNGWGLAFKACGGELVVVGGQRGPEGEGIVVNSWRVGGGGGAAAAPPEWEVIGVKEHAGVFVYNCAVMGC